SASTGSSAERSSSVVGPDEARRVAAELRRVAPEPEPAVALALGPEDEQADALVAQQVERRAQRPRVREHDPADAQAPVGRLPRQLDLGLDDVRVAERADV